eukprot:10710318-Karenia_brevis.AAC.1
MCFVIAWSIVVQWLKSRTPSGGYRFSLPRISWHAEISEITKAKLEGSYRSVQPSNEGLGVSSGMATNSLKRPSNEELD